MIFDIHPNKKHVLAYSYYPIRIRTILMCVAYEHGNMKYGVRLLHITSFVQSLFQRHN